MHIDLQSPADRRPSTWLVLRVTLALLLAAHGWMRFLSRPTRCALSPR